MAPVIGLQQPIRLATAPPKVHQHRLVPLPLQVGKEPLDIVGVNAPLQSVEHHHQGLFILAGFAAPGQIDEIAVRKFEALLDEAGRRAAQPLGQNGLQMGVAGPPGGVKVAFCQHATTRKSRKEKGAASPWLAATSGQQTIVVLGAA